MQSRLPQWIADQEPYRGIAEQISAIVRQVNSNANTVGAQGAAVTHLPGGTIISGEHSGGSGRMALVKITAYETGGGKYAGQLFSGNSSATAGVNINMPEGMAAGGNTDALVLNVAESHAASHLLPLNSFHIGLRVGRTNEAANRTIVLIGAAASQLFAVNIARDGGADGTQTAPATWTYTVKTTDNAATLAAGVALARPRPNGSMITANGFGLAFFDAVGALRLWDAGEVPATAACS